MADRFDHRGYLCRLVYGGKVKVFEIPGLVRHRVLDFDHGIAVTDPSMQDGLKAVRREARKRRGGSA